MTELARASHDTVNINGLGNLDADQTTAYTNFTPHGDWKAMSLNRDVSSEEVQTQKLDAMPGFRFSWWYTGGKVTPDDTFKDDKMTKQFVR